MKVIGLIIVVLTGSLLVYATIDFPPWGDPSSPASTHVSPRYIEKSVEETDVSVQGSSVFFFCGSLDGRSPKNASTVIP